MFRFMTGSRRSSSGRAESVSSTFRRVGKVDDLADSGGFHRRDDELRDTVAATEVDAAGGRVMQDDFDLATVSGVDDAAEDVDAVIPGKAGTWTDSCHVAFGQVDRDAGSHHDAA